jgi:hypothetical protein
VILIRWIRGWFRKPEPTPPHVIVARTVFQTGRPVRGNAVQPFHSRPVRGNAA